MTVLEYFDFTTGQTPTAAQWEAFFNTLIDVLNSVPADNLAKAAGKVAISISGDADTIDGYHAAEIVAGSYADLQTTLADLLVSADGVVISGGVATKNESTANQLDITAIKAIQKVTATGAIDRVELAATNKTTSAATSTYYLDLEDGAADYSWSTSHATGDYITIATVTTDGSGNISTVTDTRPTAVNWFSGLTPTVTVSIGTGEITETMLATGSVTQTKLGSAAVTASKTDAVAEPTASTLVKRDTYGRTAFADPEADDDAATKGYVDDLTKTRIAVLTAAGAITPTTGGAAKSSVTGTNHEYYVLAFDKDTDESVYYDFVIPPDYNGGNITPIIHWIAPAATSGAVVWTISTLGRTSNESWDTTLGTAQSVTQTTAGTSKTLNSATVTAFNPAWTAGDVVVVKVSRDADNVADTLAEDAHLLMVEIRYTGQ